MKSTRKTRKESIEKITSFMNSNLLTPAESSSLQDVLDVLEDAQEYTEIWRAVDNQIGLNKVPSIITKIMVGEEMNLGHASHLCKILSSASYNVSGRNLY